MTELIQDQAVDTSAENRGKGGAAWRVQAGTAAVCLAALVVAWLLEERAAWASYVFYALSYATGMWFAVREAAWNLSRWQVDVDFLMILVAVGAWALGEPAEGALLLVLFGGSRAMESFANDRTRSAVEALIQDVPTTANRRRGGAGGPEESVRVEKITPGDWLVVRPGERFPLDGRIERGHTVVNAAAITGESYPWEVGPGVEVPSGAINETGLVEVTALRPARESAYQKIIHLIEDAPQRRAPAQVLSERVGRIYTRVILSVSGAAFLLWWLAMGLPFREAMYRAMALLVAGSPCALVLSLPSAVLAGIAAGARRGVLFHGGKGLLGAGSVDMIMFDKTGTLTLGEPVVESVVELTPVVADREPGQHQEHLLLAAALARASTHPASRAVAAWATERGLEEPDEPPAAIQEIRGDGVVGEWRGHAIKLGRPRKGANGSDRDSMPDRSNQEAGADGPTTILSVDDEPVVIFQLREAIRPDAAPVIERLRARALRLLVLSGDAPGPVGHLARSLGLSDARAGLRPGEKSQIVQDESRKGAVVMMVGDGVNDAPALAAADVAVAMGLRGSAAALEQADVILQKDELPALVHAVDLGRFTRRVVIQNIGIATGLAVVLVGFALAGRLPLVLGVLGHEGGTVLVVLNSLRLLAARLNGK